MPTTVLDGMCVRQNMVSLLGGNSTSPEVSLSLEENSASLELDFSQLPRQQLPANPAGDHSNNYTNPSMYNCMPEAGLTKASGGTSVSPEPGLDLDNTDQRRPPTPPRRLLTTGWLEARRQFCFTPYEENYHALFTILIIVSTTMTWTTPPSDRLGYAFEPQTLASALCSVKMQIQGPVIHLLVRVNNKYEGHTDGHTDYRGSDSSPLPYTSNSGALGNPLEAIKGGVTTGIWLFAECHILCRVFYFGHSTKSSLPSATQKTLGKRKHSATKLFAECFIFDTVFF
jgi:hypothetical protein